MRVNRPWFFRSGCARRVRGKGESHADSGTVLFGLITGVWWLFLITGIAGLIIALIVLRFDTTSIATVGALLGVVFLISGLNEWMIAVVRPSSKWAHIALGILFVIGGFTAFAKPYNAFWALASLLGLLLV